MKGPALDEGEIRQKLTDFEARFGSGGKPDLYFAPGRVNLIGEHTDYNSGLVLPMAIEQGTYLMIRQSDSSSVRLYSDKLESEATFDPVAVEKTGDWADYVRGVFRFAKETCGDLPPFDGLFFGDLPLGAGLSSSASIELVTAMGLTSVGCDLSRKDAVKVSRRAENEFVGVSCGVMDQFTAAFARQGNAILLDCNTLDYRLVPYNLPDAATVIAHTGVYRKLGESPYNNRREECSEALRLLSKKLGYKENLSQVTVNEFERVKYLIPDTLARRAEHVIYENVRVEEAARCLENNNPERLGSLMNRSHASLRDNYEVSSPELDAMQKISVEQPGVWGCRMTGAGFGGCVIALVNRDALEKYMRQVTNLYWKATRLDPFFIMTAPGEGARKL